jgi:RimJ/RimL family protein N-acetyltransferase
LEESDLPMTLKWRNQDQIRRWFIHSEIISMEQHQEWFNKYIQLENDYVFIIEDNLHLQKPIGQISLYNITWIEKRAELGRLMIGDVEARCKGFAKQSAQLLVCLAFIQLHLKELYLEVFKNNSTAVAIYKKCGFQLNGIHDNLLIMNYFNPYPIKMI